MMDKGREEFEAYVNANHRVIGVGRRGDGYAYNLVQMLWEFWQASRKQALEEKEGEHRPTGFMCAIAFDHEVGFKASGNKIFPDAEDLKGHKSCGIYEVELRCVRVVVEPEYLEDRAVSLLSLEGNAKEPT